MDLGGGFDRERHVFFLQMMADGLPAEYQTQEVNHLTLAYFAVSGLALLDALDRVEKEHVASWVLSFQAFPRDKTDLNDGQFYGFHGSKTSQFTNDNKVSSHNGSHLASTYCALAILKTVGYDLSSIDPETISASMRNLQQCDGSFMPTHIGAEKDLRFLYCAAAICFMLNNWSGMDREKAKEYILQCQSYDGGFGLVPGSESHVAQVVQRIVLLLLFG